MERMPAIPDKLVILTFDDSCKSDITFAAPLLKSYGFGATFFATEGFRRGEGWEKKYPTWIIPGFTLRLQCSKTIWIICAIWPVTSIPKNSQEILLSRIEVLINGLTYRVP